MMMMMMMITIGSINIPWSKVLLEKLTVTHLVKKFPAFYGTRRFVTVFIGARHQSYPEGVHIFIKGTNTNTNMWLKNSRKESIGNTDLS
jgi:hypothetical protein